MFVFAGRRLIDDDFKKLNDEMILLEEVSDYMEKSNAAHYNDNLDPNFTDIIEPVVGIVYFLIKLKV